MEKTINFNNSINDIILEFNLPFNISFSFETFIQKNFTKNEKVDIVINKYCYRKFSNEIISLIKGKVNYTFIVVKDDYNFYLPKTLFEVNANKVIIVGDDAFIKGVNYILRDKPCSVYALYLSVYLESIFLDEYEIIYSGKPCVKKVKGLSNIILDPLFIKKSTKKDILTAYISNVLIAPTLIDYRLGEMLNGLKYNQRLYELLKQALRYTLEHPIYANFLEVLCLASFIKCAINYKSEIIKNSGVENIVRILFVNSSNIDKCVIKKYAFEKTIKLYHFFFSNEFSDLLAHPDYVNDITKLSLLLGISEEKLYSYLQIPSLKRTGLIYSLLKKVGQDFLRETTSFMMLLPKILNNFDRASKGVVENNIDLENLKDAVNYSPYLSKKPSVLTLMRDFGLLSLIN